MQGLGSNQFFIALDLEICQYIVQIKMLVTKIICEFSSCIAYKGALGLHPIHPNSGTCQKEITDHQSPSFKVALFGGKMSRERHRS